jgi:beta-phosphoglucomutase
MALKACLFDLDGVIVDTAKYHYIAWKHIADELGFEFTAQHNERLKGVSRMQSLDILLEIGGFKLGENTKEKLAAKKNAIYVDYITKINPDEILPGAEQFLKELRNNRVLIALGSASKNAPIILNRLNITSLFDVIIDGNKVSKAKPDPEVFLIGARELNVLPQECIVFEDAEAGIEAAIAGGMKSVGIGSFANLSKADLVVSGLDKLTFEMINAMMGENPKPLLAEQQQGRS